MPDGVIIPGGPGFAGSPQPPDVPCDPTGEGWRGPPGPAGAPGPPGAIAPIIATGSTTPRSVEDRAADVFNVLDFGADPTGVADSAPAFRACMGSDRTIVVPKGTYLFNSLLPLPAPYIAGMPPCVLAEGLTNFTISGYGATIKVGTGGNRSSIFMFDRSSNFELLGLTIQGDRTGLGLSRAVDLAPRSISNDPNVGIFIMSCVNFTLAGLHMTGIYVYCIQGDWWVNGVVRNVTIDSSIYGFDLAYLNGVVIDHVDATGSDLNAVRDPAHPGNGGFSCIVDPNNSPYNYTGYAFTQTQHVTLRHCRMSNFSTGMMTNTGRYWTLQGNRWHANPGFGPNIGIGVFLNYDAVSGVGQSVSNVVISGDTFANNGASTAGAAILFTNPSGADFTQDVTITGCLFDNNNNTAISAYLATNTNIRRLQSIGNTFSGALQLTNIHSGIIGSFTAVVGGASTQQTVTGPFVIGNTVGGLNFTPSVASSNSDLTHHIQLLGPQYGFSVTGNRINYNVPASSQHCFMVAGADAAVVGPGGINLMAGYTVTLSADPGSALQAATKQYVDGKVVSPSSTAPLMNSTAAVGTGTTYARADHVHASDTSRLATAGGTVSGALTIAAPLAASSVTMTSGGATGTNGIYAQGTTTGGLLASWQTAGTTPSIVGMWNSDSTLNIGTTTSAGVPTSAYWSLNTAGNMGLGGTLGANGAITSAAGIGVFSHAAPGARPTVSGAKGSNAALASLLTALVAYGLVTDSTTA